MKSYLDLVSLSTKVNRKKSRLTRICIILAVFLVSSIFGMADMEIRCQKTMAIQDDGAWHAALRNITAEQAAFISSRPEVEAGSFYACMNYRWIRIIPLKEKKPLSAVLTKVFLICIRLQPSKKDISRKRQMKRQLRKASRTIKASCGRSAEAVYS